MSLNFWQVYIYLTLRNLIFPGNFVIEIPQLVDTNSCCKDLQIPIFLFSDYSVWGKEWFIYSPRFNFGHEFKVVHLAFGGRIVPLLLLLPTSCSILLFFIFFYKEKYLDIFYSIWKLHGLLFNFKIYTKFFWVEIYHKYLSKILRLYQKIMF